MMFGGGGGGGGEGDDMGSGAELSTPRGTRLPRPFARVSSALRRKPTQMVHEIVCSSASDAGLVHHLVTLAVGAVERGQPMAQPKRRMPGSASLPSASGSRTEAEEGGSLAAVSLTAVSLPARARREEDALSPMSCPSSPERPFMRTLATTKSCPSSPDRDARAVLQADGRRRASVRWQSVPDLPPLPASGSEVETSNEASQKLRALSDEQESE